jgi:hypothetical protein
MVLPGLERPGEPNCVADRRRMSRGDASCQCVQDGVDSVWIAIIAK